jgi:two-component system sensor histidine kinase/response regulator
MNKLRIMLVDDEKNLRESIYELLTYENYEVKTASNGEKALEILDDWIPDLIISDMMMPIMDGHAFHELVKENVNLNAIPFIYLTAKKEKDPMRKYLIEGADDYISKPFKIKELLETIRSKIERFEKIKNANRNIYLGKKNYFSHEVFTPLNGILGPIDFLIENEDIQKEDILMFYEAIKISGERLNRTMQNVLLYQTLKNNILKFDTNSYAAILGTFLKERKKLFEIYESQAIRINYEIDEADLKISETYLKFILFELTDNALKFSADKTVIVSGTIYNEQFYELIIKDFGIGFSANDLNKIGAAQQFNREQNEQQGLGLGLFLSKSIIKKFKGVFSISSKEKEETTIKILLPLNI